MRTDDFRPSNNVEDDREASASRGGMPGGAGGLGIGTVIIIGLISWYFGIDPSVLLNGAQILAGGGHAANHPGAAGRDRHAARRRPAASSRWCSATPRIAGRKSSPPTARPIIRRSCACSCGSEPGGCGMAQSAMGPFYCPRDQRIYLDTSFFDDLQTKFGGCSNSKACQFSEAYVIAHEVGHHVQDELGILPRVTQQQQAVIEQGRRPMRCRSASSCRPIALPACGRTAPKPSTTSSIRAMSIRRCRPPRRSATTACRKQAQGYVVPDSFTHGTSEQRKRWFQNGFNGGRSRAAIRCRPTRSSVISVALMQHAGSGYR